MSQAAGRALIDELTEAASQPEHIYVHAWQPGDVVLWDNRCLLHVLDVGGGWLVERIVTLRIAERKKPASRIWLWEKGRNDAAVVFGFCLVGRKDLDQEPCGGAGTHSPSSSERRTLEPGFPILRQYFLDKQSLLPARGPRKSNGG